MQININKYIILKTGLKLKFYNLKSILFKLLTKLK